MSTLTRPDWIAPGRLRWVWGLWEPIELYTRGGYGAGVGDGRATGHWVRAWYERMHSDEVLDQLAEAGVNLLTTHFYKGFGLQAESAEMDRAADLARRAHLRGIRVLGYHQFSTVVYETMLDEIPHLADWIQRNPDGSFGTYGSTYWRWKACPSHDDFMAYLQRVMRRCLVDAGLDGVEFDGTAYECYCDNCQRLFREYLTKRHPEPLERFGLPHFRHVRIPSTWMPKDPVWQEWIRFRQDLMGRRLFECRRFVHETRPGAALVTYVESVSLYRRQRTRLLPEHGDYADLLVAESHDVPTVLDGRLITKVRHLHEGTALGQMTLSTAWLREGGTIVLPRVPETVERDMAECLACGGHVLTATWALRSGDSRTGGAFFEQPPFHAALRKMMGFARDHEELYQASQPLANVWVYHSLDSIQFDHGRAYDSILGWEQALLGRIAFRQAKSWQLAELGARDVLIVADQQCLSDGECAAITDAVQRGCGLILTGNSGECDENFRQRVQSPLLQLAAHPRTAYFAECPGKMPHPEYPAGGMIPVLPERAEEMRAAVRELAAEGLAVELLGAAEMLAYVDIYRTAAGVVAHVVHYGGPRPEGVRVGEWLRGTQARVFSPELLEQVAVTVEEGAVALPEGIGVYAAVVV